MVPDCSEMAALEGGGARSRPAGPHVRLARRELLIAGAALLGSSRVSAAPVSGATIRRIEARHGGRLGVFALDLATGRSLGHRAGERFKLYSTFKGLLAAKILANLSRGAEDLSAAVRFGPDDLLAASPVTTANVSKGSLTVGELCEAIMHRSDSAAANLLMARRGGPAGLTTFLRSIGDHVTWVDSYEGQIEGRPAAFDTSTPAAIARTLRRLLVDGGLPRGAAAQLEGWLQGNVVGRSRLRAAFPENWSAGDRTGTGDGWCNDFAFAQRPGRAPLIVSAYYHASGLTLETQEGVLRDVGRAVVEWERSG